jgi:hypothetical protein
MVIWLLPVAHAASIPKDVIGAYFYGAPNVSDANFDY